MTVAAILALKGNRLVTVSSDARVGEVSRILQERAIGVVLVMDQDCLLGILSERGIVRALARYQQGVVDMRAGDVLTPPKHTANPSATIEESMQIMVDRRIRYLPIVENRTLLGLLSIGDLVAAALRKRQHDVRSLTDYITGAS